MSKADYFQFEHIHFKYFESVNMYEAFASLFQTKEEKVKLSRAIKYLASLIFYYNVDISTKGTGDIWFFFTHAYANRKKYLQDFNRVLQCCKNYKSFIYRKEFNIRLKRIMYVKLVACWIGQMKTTNLTWAQKIFFASKLMSAKLLIDSIYGELHDNARLVVCFCDTHVEDYILVNYFNKLNVKTATLQHAVYEHKLMWWPNLYSHSDYFLGINEVAKYEALLSGMEVEKFKIVGSMSLINRSFDEKRKVKKIQTIGVALSGPTFEEQNYFLMESAKRIAELLNIDVIVRLHPALKRDKYSFYFKDSRMKCDTCIGIDSFVEKSDIVILGSSNMFGDLITESVITLRFVDSNNLDYYEIIDDFKFRNFEELFSRVNSISNDFEDTYNRIEVVKKYIMPFSNPYYAYKEFFDSFGGKL